MAWKQLIAVTHKQRSVWSKVHAVERWKADSNKAMNTSMWLTYEKMTTNRECVDTLKFKVQGQVDLV